MSQEYSLTSNYISVFITLLSDVTILTLSKLTAFADDHKLKKHSGKVENAGVRYKVNLTSSPFFPPNFTAKLQDTVLYINMVWYPSLMGNPAKFTLYNLLQYNIYKNIPYIGFFVFAIFVSVNIVFAKCSIQSENSSFDTEHQDKKFCAWALLVIVNELGEW